MIRTHIPHATQAQLLPNIHVPLLSFLSPFRQGCIIADVFLPRGAAVYALDHGGRGLGASPLVEAIFVDVVAAGGFAVDDFFGGGIELHEADWAVAGYFFAVGGWCIVVVFVVAGFIGIGRGSRRERRLVEDEVQFGG